MSENKQEGGGERVPLALDELMGGQTSALRTYDLFAHGPVTAFTGEWRHVGDFTAPGKDAAVAVGFAYIMGAGLFLLRLVDVLIERAEERKRLESVFERNDWEGN